MNKRVMPSAFLYGFALISATAISFSCMPAQAQYSSTMARNRHLQPAEWPHAPLEAQIIDERTRVVDCRRPDEEVDDSPIVIPPLRSIKRHSGGEGGPGFKILQRSLPPSGFGQSNIPAAGLAPSQALPSTRMGGLSPVDKPPTSVRRIGLNPTSTSNKRSTSSTQATIAGPGSGKPAASYSGNYGSIHLPSGSFSTQTTDIKRVRADLIDRKN